LCLNKNVDTESPIVGCKVFSKDTGELVKPVRERAAHPDADMVVIPDQNETHKITLEISIDSESGQKALYKIDQIMLFQSRPSIGDPEARLIYWSFPGPLPDSLKHIHN